MSRAPRPTGAAPACVRASHTAPAASGREHQLHPVLARCSRCRRPGRPGTPATVRTRRAEARRQLAVGEARDETAGLRPLDGEHRVVGDAVGHGGVVVGGVALEPGEIARVVRRVRDGEEAVRAEAVAEEVVEHPAVGPAQDRVLGAALADARPTSLETSRCRSSSACGPRVSTWPMWLTSNTPTPVRTASCSSRIPPYWTGISQPAKGTSFAPAATCRSCSGVRASVSVPAAMSASRP